MYSLKIEKINTIPQFRNHERNITAESLQEKTYQTIRVHTSRRQSTIKNQRTTKITTTRKHNIALAPLLHNNSDARAHSRSKTGSGRTCPGRTGAVVACCSRCPRWACGGGRSSSTPACGASWRGGGPASPCCGESSRIPRTPGKKFHVQDEDNAFGCLRTKYGKDGWRLC